MKIAFVQEGRKTQHGIMILSAVLKENGFETEVFSIQTEGDNLIKNILNSNSQILACSVMTPGFGRMINIINQVKTNNPNIFTIIGGPHPTFYPELLESQENLDAVCKGEGEYALLELAQSLQNNNLKTNIENLWIKKDNQIFKNPIRPLIEDLDSLPLPDRDIYFQKYPHLAEQDIKFMVGRGCPFNCSYCFNQKIKKMYDGKGKWVRFKSNEKIIEEIKSVNSKYKIKWVSFNDDTFNIDKNKLKDFLDLYQKEINLPFLTQLRIDLTSEDQIQHLKESGVDRITVGIEHGDESFRKRLLNRSMTNDQIVQFGKWLKKRKIRLHTTNIMGFPEETVDQAFSTIILNSKIKPELAVSGILSPYPGTEIYEYARDNGYLNEDFSFNNMTGQKTWSAFKSKVKSEIKNDNIPQMMSLRCFFMVLVWFPWLKPVVRQLIKIPYNSFYEFVWGITGPFRIDWRFAKDWSERKTLLKRLFLVFKKK